MQCWWLVSKGTVVLDPDGNIVDDTAVVDDDTGNPTDTDDTVLKILKIPMIQMIHLILKIQTP